MKPLSRKAKEAIKTALALTIAYAIALAMDWDKPYWAGFTVAFTSLSTYGQSLNKAAMRMAGTGLSIGVAFVLIALFPQERWLLIVFLSAWLGFCTYMMGNPERGYFWNVAGFVCVVICISAGPDAANAFDIAVLRAQETGLGVLVYSVVASLLWPKRSGPGFEAAVRQLLAAQLGLFEGCRGLRRGEADAAQIRELTAQLRQAQAHFIQMLDAAEADTFEVWEQASQWRAFRQHAAALTTSLEHWRDSVLGLQDVDIYRLCPGLNEVSAALAQRFRDIQGILDGRLPTTELERIELILDKAAARELGAFQLAELAAAGARWREFETLTRAIVTDLAAIKGAPELARGEVFAGMQAAPFVIDQDRLVSAGRAMLILWGAYLAWIYVPDLPGGVTVVSMAAPFGMIMVGTPQLRVAQIFWPAFISTLWAGLIYIFILPRLSTFVELGLLIFVTTFTIGYFYAAPQKALGKAFGIAMFLVVAQISNDQVYSFMVVANTALMLPIVFSILFIAAYIPYSPDPDKHVLRLLARYFRSSEYLLASIGTGADPRRSRLEAARLAWHRQEVATLPRKLGTWVRLVNPELLPADQPGALAEVVQTLEGLTYRIQEILNESGGEYPPAFVESLQADVRGWRNDMRKTFDRLITAPGAVDPERFRTGLDAAADHMESQVKATLERPDRAGLSDEQGADFFRLLAAYRGVAEAMGNYARVAAGIDWARWREERFA